MENMDPTGGLAMELAKKAASTENSGITQDRAAQNAINAGLEHLDSDDWEKDEDGSELVRIPN